MVLAERSLMPTSEPWASLEDIATHLRDSVYRPRASGAVDEEPEPPRERAGEKSPTKRTRKS
jgi:hypothetical protein